MHDLTPTATCHDLIKLEIYLIICKLENIKMSLSKNIMDVVTLKLHRRIDYGICTSIYSREVQSAI